MTGSIEDWRQAFREHPAEWPDAVEKGLRECLGATGQAVISRSVALPGAIPADGPLAGVPYGLKEAFDLAGCPTTGSSRSPSLARSPARADAAVVTRLRELGAVCVAKTQMNELAYGLSGENPHFGDCPHPTIASALSGGSSSGSAHLVGRGTLPFAIGTDTGGSIRVPAAWCGIYGVRWSPGYFCEGMMPLARSFDTMGWFTRDAASMAASLQAWFGTEEAPLPDRPRLSVLPAGDCLEKPTRKRLDSILERLPLGPGAETSKWSRRLSDARRAFNILQSTEAYGHYRSLIEAHGSLLDPSVIQRMLRARRWTDRQKQWAEDIRQEWVACFQSIFERFECLVMPACPGPARAAREAIKLREDLLNLTAPASLAGLPALTVPVFLNDHLSVGLQFIFNRPGGALPRQLLDLWSSI